jgi:hypothetical protein
MTNETTNSRPTHRIFAVTKNGKKKFWQPIGALWAHTDGKGFNQKLDYLRVERDDSQVRRDRRSHWNTWPCGRDTNE